MQTHKEKGGKLLSQPQEAPAIKTLRCSCPFRQHIPQQVIMFPWKIQPAQAVSSVLMTTPSSSFLVADDDNRTNQEEASTLFPEEKEQGKQHSQTMHMKSDNTNIPNKLGINTYSKEGMKKNMPLALDDPLRENLLVIAHIALGDLWSTDRNIVEPALKKLSDLCTEKKTTDAANNRKAFQLIKGYAIIVEVMNLWHKDRKLQYLCCLVILNVAEGEPDHVGTGVIDAVVAAMKAFPTFFPVQLCGCGALTSLCRSSKQNAHHLVNNLQGIETIMSAMQRYPKASNLQVWARWCLQSIHQWEDFRKAFLDAWVRSTLDDVLFEKQITLRPVVPSP
jgi:hypothetical protein